MLTEDDWAELREVLGDRLDDLEARLPAVEPRWLVREVHSLKGLAAAYGLTPVAGLFHALEDRIAARGVRAGDVAATVVQVRGILDRAA